MKMILALLALTPAAFAVDSTRLIDALIRVESNGKPNAVGDSGKAFGVLQIHEITVREANRIAGTRYTHREMFEPTKARAVAEIVLSHYSKHISKTTGRDATAKELSFIWNGGGGAWKRASAPLGDTKQRNLEAYWNKVAKAL